MSLAPSERRALARIEQALRNSDPRLAARLATFTELTSHGKAPRWKCLSPWRLRIRPLRPLMLVMLAAALLAAGLFLSHPGQPSGPTSGACGIVVGCPPPGGPLSQEAPVRRTLAGAWLIIAPFILAARHTITASMYWSNIWAGAVVILAGLGLLAAVRARAVR